MKRIAALLALICGLTGVSDRAVQAQDFPEQFPRHRHLGQLERDVAAMRALLTRAC